MLEQKTAWCMSDILKEICRQYEERDKKKVFADNGWCVYTKEHTVTLDTVCFIDDGPSINDHDEEIYPAFVCENHLKFLFMGDLVQDVVMSCLDQRDDVSLEKILEAIVYYYKHDTFLVLE